MIQKTTIHIYTKMKIWSIIKIVRDQVKCVILMSAFHLMIHRVILLEYSKSVKKKKRDKDKQ